MAQTFFSELIMDFFWISLQPGGVFRVNVLKRVSVTWNGQRCNLSTRNSRYNASAQVIYLHMPSKTWHFDSSQAYLCFNSSFVDLKYAQKQTIDVTAQSDVVVLVSKAENKVPSIVPYSRGTTHVWNPHFRSFGRKCTVFKKVLATLQGLFDAPQWFGVRGIVPPCPPRYAPATFTALYCSGIDLVGLLGKMGIELSSTVTGASTFVIAYAVHKVSRDSNCLLQWCHFVLRVCC